MTKESEGPEHHHFTFFAVPETITFKISLISSRSSLPTAGSARARVSSRPECQPDASWQFRRPAFHGPEPRIFTLDRGARSGARAHFSLCRGVYLPKFGVSTPPPPPPGRGPALFARKSHCVTVTGHIYVKVWPWHKNTKIRANDVCHSLSSYKESKSCGRCWNK